MCFKCFQSQFWFVFFYTSPHRPGSARHGSWEQRGRRTWALIGGRWSGLSPCKRCAPSRCSSAPPAEPAGHNPSEIRITGVDRLIRSGWFSYIRTNISCCDAFKVTVSCDLCQCRWSMCEHEVFNVMSCLYECVSNRAGSQQTHLLINDHAAVALGEGGQQDPGGQLGGEGAPQGGEACRQLAEGVGGGRGWSLYQPRQSTHLQNREWGVTHTNL